MKTIILGDTHGRTVWQEIVAKNSFDKIVFIGDYFDTHEDISARQQKENFRNIVTFKNQNNDKVVLLFGNHDFHYLGSADETYSGYQQRHKTDIQEMLHAAIDAGLLQMCYLSKNFLLSHAGVTKTWCRANNINLSHLENSINDLFIYKPNAFKFKIGKNHSEYGDDVSQSPIWVRPNSLLEDAVDGFIQVVGHTTQENLALSPNVTLIDTLGTSGEFLIIENGKMSVGQHEH